MIESLWLQIGPYLNLLHSGGHVGSPTEHYHDLLQCLHTGDIGGARAALTADMVAAAEMMRQQMRA